MNHEIQKLTDKLAGAIAALVDQEATRRATEDRTTVFKTLLNVLHGKFSDAPAVLKGLGAPPNAIKAAARAEVPPRKRRPRTAAEKKASKLQGTYMGKTHALHFRDRAKVKAMRKKAGVVKAIQLATKLAKAGKLGNNKHGKKSE